MEETFVGAKKDKEVLEEFDDKGFPPLLAYPTQCSFYMLNFEKHMQISK